MSDRHNLKSNWDLLKDFESDQSKGIEHPPLQKPVPEGVPLVSLPVVDMADFPDSSISEAVMSRKSVRSFTDEPVSIDELSWLLFATQGVKSIVRNGIASFRTVPSGGARHPFETYLSVNNISELEPGLYRYLPFDHALAHLGDRIPPSSIIEGCLDQRFTGECSVTFIWTVLPYRTEWRYGPVSHKVIALDAGHVCQNLYLACTASGLGTCAIGAYDQDIMDSLLDLDGRDEFVIYIAPVGRI
ncbi:MAG: SagB/ThcOx family dehydrogenase [Candidatus Aegiribacteria sp.]|nr:SagB/ThcOx family dehydrogenase [Candidatus Aegiribacteria sp.]